MVRYYCSGFDIENAFGHGIGDMLRREIKDTKCIAYIPGSLTKIEKAKNKYVPAFVEHFRKIGIIFDEVCILMPDMKKEEAKEIIKRADFVMLMGGDPFDQKILCEKLDIMQSLKEFKGVMMGFSAGAMLMSKHIIITPCSEEYPNFHIEDGLNLDGLSIYPHNNTEESIYPEVLDKGDEVYKKADLLTVAKTYGKFYLLQDIGKSISYIKSVNGKIEFRSENNGRMWEVNNDIQIHSTINV